MGSILLYTTRKIPTVTNTATFNRDESLHQVNEGSTMYKCLQYPLFFIYGEDGYHYNLTTSPDSTKRLSRTDYTTFYIQQCEHEFLLLTPRWTSISAVFG